MTAYQKIGHRHGKWDCDFSMRTAVSILLILLLLSGCGKTDSQERKLKIRTEMYLRAMDEMLADPLDKVTELPPCTPAGTGGRNEEILESFREVMTRRGLDRALNHGWMTPEGLEIFLRLPVGEFTPDTREIIGCDELSDSSWDCTVVCQDTERQIRILLNLRQEDGEWKVASMRHRRAE